MTLEALEVSPCVFLFIFCIIPQTHLHALNSSPWRVFLNCSCTNTYWSKQPSFFSFLVWRQSSRTLDPNWVCTCSKCSSASVMVEVCLGVWLCAGSLASALQSHKHHFSSDELSGLLLYLWACDPDQSSALPQPQSCLCSFDPAIMRSSSLLVWDTLSFPTVFNSLQFYSLSKCFALMLGFKVVDL